MLGGRRSNGKQIGCRQHLPGRPQSHLRLSRPSRRDELRHDAAEAAQRRGQRRQHGGQQRRRHLPS